MSAPTISVIIPTYNRKASLLRTLESLARQTYPAERFEVIVVDDGGNDDTEKALQKAGFLYRLIYQKQAHAGVSTARNLGLQTARGEIVLFLDDDMKTDARLIAEHVETHKDYPNAVVKGQVILKLDDLQSVFASIFSGQADLPTSLDGQIQRISYQQVFAGHFSIRREDAMDVGGWAEDLRTYGFRDLEFMYRCVQSGLEMFYNPQALTYHYDHASTLTKVCERQRRASRSAVAGLFILHPELRYEIPMFRDKGPIEWRKDPLLLILRKLIRQVAAFSLVIGAMKRTVPVLERHAPTSTTLRLLYRWIISGYIYRGYREGLHEYEATGKRARRETP